MPNRFRARPFIWLALASVLVLAYLTGLYRAPERKIFRIYNSPRTGFYLLVYRTPSFLPGAPGDGDGGTGLVVLCDENGRQYGEARVPILAAISSASDVKWDDHEVMLPGAFVFQLPHRD